MSATETASREASDSMDPNDRDYAADVLAAAAAGDKLGFAAAAARYGSLEKARELVRERGVLRSIDRVSTAALPAPALNEDNGSEQRAAGAAGGSTDGNTMYGHFAVFDQWTEINSWFEGNFMERIAPGAFKKTIAENRPNIRALFQHGHDPSIGDKPLGPVDVLREDTHGAYYEVPLLDARYVQEDVLPGLRAGLYAASFRFQAMREEMADDPGVSAHNPKGLPERTLKELRLYEFGPVTFPAYEGATAGVRSAADTPDSSTDAPVEPTPAEATSEKTRREPVHTFKTREEYLRWLSSI